MGRQQIFEGGREIKQTKKLRDRKLKMKMSIWAFEFQELLKPAISLHNTIYVTDFVKNQVEKWYVFCALNVLLFLGIACMQKPYINNDLFL